MMWVQVARRHTENNDFEAQRKRKSSTEDSNTAKEEHNTRSRGVPVAKWW
jgi:hypothetical protein